MTQKQFQKDVKNKQLKEVQCVSKKQDRNKWTFGANSVQLTGTFNNWVDPIPLKKMDNNCFEIILKLSPGVYQYKYIVDDEWRFSPEDPTCNDENGNINNIIDTTNIERSMSLIGQNAGSTKFLTMGSQNNSVNFIQTNNRIMNSNGNVNTQSMQQQNPANIQNLQNTQQNIQNYQNQMGMNSTFNSNNNRTIINPQLQFSVQQQQFYAQLQQQQLLQQQQNIHFPQQQNQTQTANIHPQNIQMMQQAGNNNIQGIQFPFAQQNIQQQQQQQLQQQDLLKMAQNAHLTVPTNLQQNQHIPHQQQQYAVHPSQNISPMQAMYFRASHNNTFDKSQLLIKAHITQQNQTNFDVAFKDSAPQMPPHLLEVPTIKRRNAQQVSMWREKKPRPQPQTKSIFSSNLSDKNSMAIEESDNNNHNQNHFGNGQLHTLQNTAEDDAEVLMHVFQPGHSITPVDHVTLNNVGIDNLSHNDKYNVYCITQRFKTKYTTYKFYTSKYDTQIII